MQSKSILDYISFGTGLRYLQDAKKTWSVHVESAILDNINRFFDNLEEFNLPVTQRAAYKLRQFGDELAQSDTDHKLSADEASEISKIMTEVRNTLFAEAGGNIALIVVDKRIDVNKLLSDVPALMAPGIFAALPDIAQYDFIEAGKCIAFERSTAAAFHLLRGTEAVLRDFYCSIVKRNRAKLMWGSMVGSLRKRKHPPPLPLLDNLDNIRRSFRNPTQHPDKRYDIQEVQDLFGLCIDVVNRMVGSHR